VCVNERGEEKVSSGEVGWGQRIISLWLLPAFLLSWGCYRADERLSLLGERGGGAVKLSRLFVDQKRAEKKNKFFFSS